MISMASSSVLQSAANPPSPRATAGEGPPSPGTEACRFLCPECLAPAVAAGDVLSCARTEEHRRPVLDGIYPLLSRERLKALQPFLESYRRVRRAEGWGGDADYYLALPFEDGSRRHQDVWRLRGRSFRVALEEIEKRSGSRPLDILELGAGNCWCAARLAERGHRVLATDLDRDGEDGLGALDRFRHRLRQAPERAEADMVRLALEDAQFDLVVANGSFHYAGDLSAAAKESRRVLRDGGALLILDSPTYSSAEAGKAMVREREREHRERYDVLAAPETASGFLVRSDFERLLARVGFEVDVIHPFQGLDRTVRRFWAGARGLREPADFPVWVARR